MTLELYKTQSERNRLDKILTDKITLTGTLKSESNIISPIILITANFGDIVNYNYAKIVDFNRFYFISNVTVVRNNLYRLTLSVDVLTTYKNQIRQCNGKITKSETPNQWKLEKDLADTLTEKSIDFDNEFNFNGINVMITASGNETVSENGGN